MAVRQPTWALPFLIVLDPFDVARYAGHTTITTFKAALVGICIALVQRRALFVPQTRSMRAVLVCLFGLAVVTSLTISEAVFRAPAIRETLKAIEYALIFYVAACVAREEPRAIRAASLSAAAAVLFVALGSINDFSHPQSGIWIGDHAYLRIAGALEGPNQLASWLGLMLPIALVESIPGLWIAIAIGCVLLALTLSRGGSVQTIGALIAIAVLSRSAQRTVVVSLLAFFLTLGGLAWIARTGAASAHVVSLSSSVDRGGTGSREILWHSAAAMFTRHPLLGVGAGNFEFMLGTYGAPPQVRTQANSLYLEALADGGILLGIVTIATAWLPPLFLLRAKRAPITLAVGIAGIALAAHGFLDDVTFYTKVGQCWWLIAGVAYGTIERREDA